MKFRCSLKLVPSLPRVRFLGHRLTYTEVSRPHRRTIRKNEYIFLYILRVVVCLARAKLNTIIPRSSLIQSVVSVGIQSMGQIELFNVLLGIFFSISKPYSYVKLFVLDRNTRSIELQMFDSNAWNHLTVSKYYLFVYYKIDDVGCVRRESRTAKIYTHTEILNLLWTLLLRYLLRGYYRVSSEHLIISQTPQTSTRLNFYVFFNHGAFTWHLFSFLWEPTLFWLSEASPFL